MRPTLSDALRCMAQPDVTTAPAAQYVLHLAADALEAEPQDLRTTGPLTAAMRAAPATATEAEIMRRNIDRSACDAALDAELGKAGEPAPVVTEASSQTERDLLIFARDTARRERDSLAAKLAEAEKEVERLRGGAGAGTLPEFAQMLAGAARGWLNDAGADNYVEVTLGNAAERFAVCVQRVEGKTPHEMRVEAERERDEARAERDRLQGEVEYRSSAPDESALIAEGAALAAKTKAEVGDEPGSYENAVYEYVSNVDQFLARLRPAPPSFTDCEKAVEEAKRKMPHMREGDAVVLAAILRDCTKPADVAALARAVADAQHERNIYCPKWSQMESEHREAAMACARDALDFLRLPAREGKVDREKVERAIFIDAADAGGNVAVRPAAEAAIRSVLSQLGEQRKTEAGAIEADVGAPPHARSHSPASDSVGLESLRSVLVAYGNDNISLARAVECIEEKIAGRPIELPAPVPRARVAHVPPAIANLLRALDPNDDDWMEYSEGRPCNPRMKERESAAVAEWRKWKDGADPQLQAQPERKPLEVDLDLALRAYWQTPGGVRPSVQAAIDVVLAQLGEQRGSA